MADNTTVDNGALTDYVVADDEVGGAKYQYVKIAYGVDGTATILNGTTDLDTGAGTDTRPVVGILLGASGGGALWPGDATDGAKVQVTTMPAAAATTDTVAVSLRTDKIANNLTELTPKFFSESVTASDTDQELVAAVASKKLRVTALAVQCAGTATTITFESSTTTRIHKVPAGANGGQILPFNPAGWFQSAAGESLTCTTGAGSTTEISGQYIEV
jgi:hypothetical protein